MKLTLNLTLLLAVLVQQSSASKSTSAAMLGPKSMINANSGIIHRKLAQHDSSSNDEEMDAMLHHSRSQSRSVSPVVSVRGGAENNLQARLKVGFYFALWYALNVVYNSKSRRLHCVSCHNRTFCHNYLITSMNLNLQVLSFHHNRKL